MSWEATTVSAATRRACCARWTSRRRPAAEPLLEAVDVLRSDGTARPTGFLRPNSRWSRLLRTQSDHRLWETAVLFHLRDAFRAGDVWLARSRRYGDIRKALLSTPAGESIEDSVLRVERTEAAVPDGAADLVADLYRRLPEARITDILLEVDDATRFTEAFTHLRTGSSCRDRIGLLNVLLAEGINLGLRKMAEATTTHGFWELMRIARWHVEADAYDRALSIIVEAQAALPMAAFWGTGRTPPATASSSRPPAAAKPSIWSTPATGPNPASRHTRTSPTASLRSPPRPSRPPSTRPPTSLTGS